MKQKIINTLMTGVYVLTISLLPLATTNTLAAEETGYKPFKSTVMEEERAKEQQKLSHIAEGEAYIPAETIINVELTDAISSKTIKKGERVPLRTLENIIINNVIVIPAGTPVEGVVTKATKSGLFGRSGKLEFTINSVKTVNNVRIPLQYVAMKEAGSDGGAVAVAALVSVVGGLFMKGKNVDFPAGTQFQAKVTTDTDLHVTLKDLPTAMDPNKPHGVSITIQ